MSIDPDDSVLEQALRSDLPSDDAKERVRRRLLAAGVAVGNGVAATTSAAATGAATTTGVVAKAVGASWGIKLGLAAAITIPSAGLLLDAQSKPQSTESAPSARRTQREPAPLVERAQPAAAVAAPAPAEAAAPTKPARAPAALEPAASPPARLERAPAGEAAADPRSQATTLAEETRLLDGAFAELAAGRRARAAQLIAEHEARFPGGLLQKERERAKAKLSESSRGE